MHAVTRDGARPVAILPTEEGASRWRDANLPTGTVRPVKSVMVNYLPRGPEAPCATCKAASGEPCRTTTTGRILNRPHKRRGGDAPGGATQATLRGGGA